MRRSKASVRDTYDRIASSYASSRTRPWPEVLEFIATLPARSAILDVGCGHGRHAKPAARAGHRVVGVDLCRPLLAIGRDAPASRIRDPVEWVVGDATSLPVRDSTFDAALCVAVLHHLPSRDDRLASLAEVRRVLRPSGRAFVSVWARDNPYLRDVVGVRSEDDDVEVPWHLPDGTEVPRFYHLFSEGELERLIIESRLHGERFFRASGNDFAVATKHG
ncbi:MAG TPA: class I SAM-dependent methyltransferase [Thermoplasmata archaeon]